MAEPVLELLVGMIGSGKSTYALQRAREGAIIICHDALVEGFHGEYRYEQGLRSFYRHCEVQMVRAAIDMGLSVVIDRTHLTRESRTRWVRLAGRRGVPCRAVVFPRVTAQEHARRRFVADPRGRSYEDWLMVAQHHEAQAEAEPFDETAWQQEGFDEVVFWADPPGEEGGTQPRPVIWMNDQDLHDR